VGDSLATRSMAHAIGLMQRVGDVVGQGTLLQHPLVVGRDRLGSARTKNSVRVVLFIEFARPKPELSRKHRSGERTWNLLASQESVFFFRPFGAGPLLLTATHALRRGLRSFAASRLGTLAH
jgi:hypothetical protein